MMAEKRKNQIEVIEKSVYKLQLKDKPIIRKQIIIATMSKLNLSKRTASEYVDVVFFNLGISS